MSDERRVAATAPWLQPLQGAAVGAAGAAVFWLAARLWPASVAVALAMLTLGVLERPRTAALIGSAGSVSVLVVLLRYNALMALSAAQLPFALPGNLALGLLIIAALSASRAVSVALVGSPESPSPRATEVSLALVLGFAPAALLGIPGLIGGGAALLAGMAFCALAKRAAGAPAEIGAVRIVAELALYLGALAAWPLI